MKELAGIRVLDFTHLIAGPYCTRKLADHGAEVIEVRPIQEETLIKTNHTYENLHINEKKQILAADLKTNEGKHIVHTLVKSADLLVTNYPKGLPEKLGIDFCTIIKLNPKICMVKITSFGLFDEKCHDRELCGLNFPTDETILREDTCIQDNIAGMQGVIGAILALRARDKFGNGQFVDSGKLDSLMSLLDHDLLKRAFRMR